MYKIKWERFAVPDDITNAKLFGLISAETVIALLFACIGFAMAWQALADEVEVTKQNVDDTRSDVSKIEHQQKAIKEDVSQMRVNLGIIQSQISTQTQYHHEYHKELKDDIKFIRTTLESR